MLDQSSLAQLSQLKTAIIASKEYAEGIVVGSKGNYGFVRLDDGRDAFLNNEKMQRVLPGDRVKVLLTKNDKDQLEGQLEALLATGLKRFVAEYKTKDHLSCRRSSIFPAGYLCRRNFAANAKLAIMCCANSPAILMGTAKPPPRLWRDWANPPTLI